MIIRDHKSAFDMLSCFIPKIFFWLTTYDKHRHNLVLLKFTIKQLEIILALDRYLHDIEAKCVT